MVEIHKIEKHFNIFLIKKTPMTLIWKEFILWRNNFVQKHSVFRKSGQKNDKVQEWKMKLFSILIN